MVVMIYGSLVTQWILRGQLRIVERVLDGDIFSWGLMLHSRMMEKIHRSWTIDSGEFAFGSILVAWFLDRVPLLCLRILLAPSGLQEMRLMRWAQVIALHGGGEGGNYFTATVARVWHHMP